MPGNGAKKLLSRLQEHIVMKMIHLYSRAEVSVHGAGGLSIYRFRYIMQDIPAIGEYLFIMRV
jgi:hypothetical protein